MTKRHARLTHPRTGRPIVPLGYRRNGAPIWPILGASPDDQPPPADDTPADGGDPPADDTPADGDGADIPDPEGADQLGDPGKQALDRMKADLREERRQKRELERQLAEAKKPPVDENAPPDPEALREEGRREAQAEADKRIIRAEAKAAATGKLADPSDALTFIDLTAFEVDADGNVDSEELADAIDELIRKKPYLAAQGGRRFQGGADGGNRKGTQPPSLDEQIAAATAEGRVRDVIALNNRRLAEVAGKS